MTNKITYEQVVAVADRLVEERGHDYRYVNSYGNDTCVYGNHKGEPQCIVGHILYELAPDVFATVHEGEVNETGDGINERSEIIGSYSRVTNEVFSERAERFMERTQSRQDFGDTWAESVEVAKEYAK